MIASEDVYQTVIRLYGENKRLRELVKKAADWIDPDCSPPELYSERAIVAELRHAVESNATQRG